MVDCYQLFITPTIVTRNQFLKKMNIKENSILFAHKISGHEGHFKDRLCKVLEVNLDLVRNHVKKIEEARHLYETKYSEKALMHILINEGRAVTNRPNMVRKLEKILYPEQPQEQYVMLAHQICEYQGGFTDRLSKVLEVDIDFVRRQVRNIEEAKIRMDTQMDNNSRLILKPRRRKPFLENTAIIRKKNWNCDCGCEKYSKRK